MKLGGGISGKPFNLGTCWTFYKKRLENTELVRWLEGEIHLLPMSSSSQDSLLSISLLSMPSSSKVSIKY